MTTSPSLSNNSRIQSVDVLRGLVMIIMAIDHVRVYSGIPAGGLTAGIFFTRWVTHFCAPAFAFFAGTSAFLYYQKCGSKKMVANFLLTRGGLLVVLELIVVRFFWMFNLRLGEFMFTGVIWMLGWCMILLAFMLWMSPRAMAIVGILIILFQQVFSYVPEIMPESIQASFEKVWMFFYPPASTSMAAAAKLTGISALPKFLGMSAFYVLIPWIGVMMTGFGFGKMLVKKSDERKILAIGVISTFLFIVGAVVMATQNENNIPFLFKVLGQQKYPPSQLYLLMTLGPIIALVPWAERIGGRATEIVKVIGKVPMFYYLLHILLIHVSSLVVNIITKGSAHEEWYVYAPFVTVPQEEQWGLPLLYLVWAIDVVILYFACRWYLQFKAGRPHIKWLKYI